MGTSGTTASHRFRNLITSVDSVTILYLLISLFYVLILSGIIGHSGFHILIRIGMITGIGLIILADSKYNKHWIKIFHDLYPLAFLAFFYTETYALHYDLHPLLDPGLIEADQHIFGFLPSETFSQVCSFPWFSELMYLGYLSFYLIILFFVLGYYIKLPGLFPSRFYIFLQSFYIFYLIFILFPSEGPQYFLSGSSAEVIPEGAIGRFVHLILRLGDRPTGAFPSSHIGMTWLILFFFLRDNHRWFYIWIIPSVILTFSTVYIREHYAVDVIGGLIMAVTLYYTGFFTTGILKKSSHNIFGDTNLSQ